MAAEAKERELPVLSLRSIRLNDEHVVKSVLNQLTTYSMRVDGVPEVDGASRRFLTAVPPGCAISRKHVFAIMDGSETVGLVDLIARYPEASKGFLGLLAIREDRRNEGLGRRAYELVEQFAREHLKAATIRLAVVDTNPVGGFWKTMGFKQTGEIKYQGKARTSNAILMEKRIG